MENFRRRASSCFLFTKIIKIAGLVRENTLQTYVLWSFGAQRTLQVAERETGCSATQVVITTSDDAVESRWIVATERLEEGAIPREILSSLGNHRLRIPAVLGLAFLIEDKLREPRSFGFFSTLPLGIETALPCHVMGSFLLSSDRRSIRLDENGTESRFNIWLLSSALPRLYLFLLQTSLEYGDNKRWWPSRLRGKEDGILVDSFYSEHLRLSHRHVFYNKFRPENTLTSQQVVLSRGEPENIQKLLSKLETETVIRPSQAIYQLMTSKSELQLVNPAFVRSVIMGAPPFIFSEWDFKIIEDCIVYLLGKECNMSDLLGLTIIPLEDGTFGTFHDRSDDPNAECYYIWTPKTSSRKHNFSPKQFVHPNLRAKVRETLLKTQLNVVPLDASVMTHLIGEMFSSQPHFALDLYRVEASPQLSKWISDFWVSWPEYDRLGLSSSDVLSYPLVPTVRSSWYTSLSSCQNALSLIVEGDDQYFEDIRYFLDKLDLNVIRLSSEEVIPSALYGILKTADYPEFDIQSVLQALHARHNSNSFVELLHDCDREKQASFASWARNDVKQPIPTQLQPVAQQLPLWFSASKNLVEPDLRPASDIYMLPEGLQFDPTAQFMSVFVAGYSSLRYFNGPTLTYGQIQERLELPRELSTSELPSYRRFLELWLPLLLGERTEAPMAVHIPNCNRLICLSDTLYARDPLFEVAFGTHSPLLIHQDYMPLKTFLYRHGLKTERQLDIDMFLQCANAFEESQTDDNATTDRIARAEALYRAYEFSLPMSVTTPEESQRWSELDDLNFIPRNVSRRRLLRSQNESVLGMEIPPNVSALSMIVSPVDLVRADFEAVAWSQRAMFARQPDPRVLMAYPSLGLPSCMEVVSQLSLSLFCHFNLRCIKTAHLQYLSKLIELSRSQREIVIHDLEASYRFLDEHHAEVSANSLLQTESVFLNVNDPNVDEWKWDKADELVFETHDIDDSIRHVRNFLSPFRRLLQVAGVLQIYYPEYPAQAQPPNTSNSRLLSICSGFQRLRENNVLTDVVFLTSGDDKDQNFQSIMAHRNFLAVSSEYFWNLFAQGYQEAGQASEDNPVTVQSDRSRDSIQLVLGKRAIYYLIL